MESARQVAGSAVRIAGMLPALRPKCWRRIAVGFVSAPILGFGQLLGAAQSGRRGCLAKGNCSRLTVI